MIVIPPFLYNYQDQLTLVNSYGTTESIIYFIKQVDKQVGKSMFSDKHSLMTILDKEIKSKDRIGLEIVINIMDDSPDSYLVDYDENVPFLQKINNSIAKVNPLYKGFLVMLDIHCNFLTWKTKLLYASPKFMLDGNNEYEKIEKMNMFDF